VSKLRSSRAHVPAPASYNVYLLVNFYLLLYLDSGQCGFVLSNSVKVREGVGCLLRMLRGSDRQRIGFMHDVLISTGLGVWSSLSFMMSKERILTSYREFNLYLKELALGLLD